MYKALIVDDEPKVRSGLTKLIPTLDAEWTVVGQAKNGNEALELVRREMPDLVITDIRMPNMNGLDLLNVLREYPVQVVILSGYGYFEYAKTAIRFGAFDYLLKPLKPDEVRDLLGRLKKEIRKPEAGAAAITADFHYVKLWKDWLLGIEDSADHLDRLCGQLPEGVSGYHIIAIDIEDFDELVTEDQWGDRQLVVFAVRNIVYEILHAREDVGSRFLFANASQIYFLLHGGPCPRDVYELMIYEVRRWVRISISVGISGRTGEFAELPRAFTEAREALLNRWIYGSGLVHEHGELARTSEGNAGNAPGYPSDLDEALVLALREGDEERVREVLRRFVGTVLEQNVVYPVFHGYCLQLLSSVVRYVHEQKITALVFQDELKPYEWFQVNFSADEFIRFVDELTAAAIEKAEWKKQQKHNRTLETAVSFIHRNYMHDISLNDVACKAGMSSSYFSSFFKQEMGMSFIEYLTQFRMDKAKNLMMDPDLKLYNISEMVGYQDVKYFSRLFKKTEGVTPGEYRQFFYRKDEDDEK